MDGCWILYSVYPIFAGFLSAAVELIDFRALTERHNVYAEVDCGALSRAHEKKLEKNTPYKRATERAHISIFESNADRMKGTH